MNMNGVTDLGDRSVIRGIDHLEDVLSEPPDYLIEQFASLSGDILILGSSGKMGATLARMARRASATAGCNRRIIAVSRHFSTDIETNFKNLDIEMIRCDLMEPAQVAQLPDAHNVIFMVGMKFGTSNQESLTWATNTYISGIVAQRYRNSRIVAFSTGNIYGLTPICFGGSKETNSPAPVGEYAMSALGRERVFEHFSRTYDTPLTIFRLNYACELRYGVLLDIAENVWSGKPVDVAMAAFNVIWQGDACAMALASLDHAANPPFILNAAGPEILSIRRVAEQFADLMGKTATFVNLESSDALISNGQLGNYLYAYPRICAQQMIHWIADWVMRGEQSIGKPTGFQVRDGRY